MRLGIMQGRLSQPREGYQECPWDWPREFGHLPQLGLSHIEWVITKKSFNYNPYFYGWMKEYPIHTVCADNMVDRGVCNSLYVENNLKPICESTVSKGIKSVTIPLLEDSDVSDDKVRKEFCSIFKEYTQQYKSLEFWIEAELEVGKLIEILSISDNVFVTYDTGNITSCGFDHGEYISNVYPRIRNVHLKDRTFTAESVVPLSGDTDFKKIFKILKEKGYNGIYTLQTCREEPGLEFQTILKHKQVLEDLYNE